MNRAFIYGDLLFETIKVVNGSPNIVAYHYDRLIKSAAVLEFKLPQSFNLDVFYNQLQNAIDKVAGKNNFKDQYRIRYTLYRNSTGFYLPDSHQTDYHIDIFPYEDNGYFKRLNVGIYKEQRKTSGPLANIKSGNALIYIMAKMWAKKNNLDDALLLNQHGRFIEASSSNLFWVKDGITYTPPLSEGCVEGIFRTLLFEQDNITEKVCRIDDLELADEIFLTNVLEGKRFINLDLFV